MTKQQKLTLQDCFEGCMSLNHALAIIGTDTKAQDRDAIMTWRRWEREMDEIGHYTF